MQNISSGIYIPSEEETSRHLQHYRMAPVASNSADTEDVGHSRLKKPLEYSGSLDNFEHTDVTPVVGRLYPTIQIRDLLEAQNARQLLQDLAYTSKQSTLVVI